MQYHPRYHTIIFLSAARYTGALLLSVVHRVTSLLRSEALRRNHLWRHQRTSNSSSRWNQHQQQQRQWVETLWTLRRLQAPPDVILSDVLDAVPAANEQKLRSVYSCQASVRHFVTFMARLLKFAVARPRKTAEKVFLWLQILADHQILAALFLLSRKIVTRKEISDENHSAVAEFIAETSFPTQESYFLLYNILLVFVKSAVAENVSSITGVRKTAAFDK